MNTKKDYKKIRDFTGIKRQMLTAVKIVRYNQSAQIWLFSCDCGGSIKRIKSNFINSRTNNCGCRHGLTKHNMSVKDKTKYTRHPVYQSWVNARQRCYNPNNPNYDRYGERGIKMCERWNDFSKFVEDMGIPEKGYTLDRINNDEDYSPDNCKWSTRLEQVLNRTCTSKITYNGVTMTLNEWAKTLPFEISWQQLYKRYFTRHWSAKRTLTQPTKTK